MNKLFTFLILFLSWTVLHAEQCANKQTVFFSSKSQSDSVKAEVWPFVLSPYNNIIFKTVLNGRDTLDLKFDSGAAGLLLTHDAIREKTDLLNDGTESTPTRNYVPLKAPASLQIGEMLWDSLEVWPVRLSGQGSDGRFGWDLFKDKVMVIDYDNNEMSILDSLPDTAGYEALKLEVVSHGLCFHGKIHGEGFESEGRFLFDTGYQKALLLDSNIQKEEAFVQSLELLSESELRNGAGDVFLTRIVKLPGLSLGDADMSDIPTQLFTAPNPAGFETHILGNELLKRFNTIVDLRNMMIYLKKSSRFDVAYSDTP